MVSTLKIYEILEEAKIEDKQAHPITLLARAYRAGKTTSAI